MSPDYIFYTHAQDKNETGYVDIVEQTFSTQDILCLNNSMFKVCLVCLNNRRLRDKKRARPDTILENERKMQRQSER